MKIQFKIYSILLFLLLSSCDLRNRPVHISNQQIQNVKNLASCIVEKDSTFSKKLPMNMAEYFSKCSDVQCFCASEYERLNDFSEVTITEKTIIFRIKKESGYEEVFYHNLIFLKKNGTPPIEIKWNGEIETHVKKLDSSLYYKIYHRLGS